MQEESNKSQGSLKQRKLTMNEIQAWVVAMSLVVGSVGIVGIFVMMWRLVDVLRDIADVLEDSDDCLKSIATDTEKVASEVERLANEIENWNTAVEEELNLANEILSKQTGENQ